jgi:hypothetical protein
VDAVRLAAGSSRVRRRAGRWRGCGHAGSSGGIRHPREPEADPDGRKDCGCDRMRRGIERADVLGVVVIAIVVMIFAVVRVAVVAGSRAIGFVVTDAAACGAHDAAAFAEPAAVESLGGQAGNCCQSEQSDEPAQGRTHRFGCLHTCLVVPTGFVRVV